MALRALRDIARVNLKGCSADCESFAAALGHPTLPPLMSVSSAGSSDLLALAPDEWLLLGAGPIKLPSTVGNVSVVNVTDRQCAIEIAGRTAADLIAAGCPLDLRSRAFPEGRCTRTLFGRSEITLWRKADQNGAPVYHIEVWRSYASYLWLFLTTALRDI